jgi:hypothetical protein
MPKTMARKATAFLGSMRSSAGAMGPIVVSAAMTAHSGMKHFQQKCEAVLRWIMRKNN